MVVLSLLAFVSLALSAAALAPLPTEDFKRAGLSDAFVRTSLDARAKCTINETYPAPTLPSLLDLVKRNAFVERRGTELFLAGEPFRIVGPNIYWLGLDENVGIAFPSKDRVLGAMATVSAMRGTVIRGHTLGVSVGLPLSLEPKLDVFHDDAYEAVDFAILAARVYGLKLMIPLTDNYNWYHGGKYQFIEWHGIPFQGTGASITPADVGGYFYNTTAIVDSFKRFITHHLNHVNRYTGIALKDDPTIIGWETGNELSATRYITSHGPPPAAWTRDIASFVKKLAPRHLIFDGTFGIFPESGQLAVTEVDVFSDHFYPLDSARMLRGLAEVRKAGRPYLAGEIDWTGQHGGTELGEFLTTLEAQRGTGSLFWSVFGRSDDCCSFVEHDDGYSFFYERDAFYTAQGDKLIAHAQKMNKGKAAPEILPQLVCPAPGIGGAAQKLLAQFLPGGKAGAALKSAMA